MRQVSDILVRHVSSMLDFPETATDPCFGRRSGRLPFCASRLPLLTSTAVLAVFVSAGRTLISQKCCLAPGNMVLQGVISEPPASYAIPFTRNSNCCCRKSKLLLSKTPLSRAVGPADGTALDTPDTNDIHHLRNLTAASTPRLALKPVQITSPGHQQTKAGTECAANHIPT